MGLDNVQLLDGGGDRYLSPIEKVGKASIMPRGGKRQGRPTELGVTITPLLPTAPATNGHDNEPLRTNPRHKHTVEELYEMRQILLATLPPLGVNDHEGIICLLLEAATADLSAKWHV